ncbi:MAG: flagellar hook-length control protein FliK [Sphingomonadales bacterium]|nr:flagellar hook-length control protein FliK [Sphingomonadales bacterium]
MMPIATSVSLAPVIPVTAAPNAAVDMVGFAAVLSIELSGVSSVALQKLPAPVSEDVQLAALPDLELSPTDKVSNTGNRNEKSVEDAIVLLVDAVPVPAAFPSALPMPPSADAPNPISAPEFFKLSKKLPREGVRQETAPRIAAPQIAQPESVTPPQTLAAMPDLATPPVVPAVSIASANPEPLPDTPRLQQTAPLDRLFAVIAQSGAADRQWLDTVIGDVKASGAPNGDVRFQVEPEGFGKVTIDRTADHLKIGVTDAHNLAVVEAARVHVLTGAQALGAPVSAATIFHDQPGFRDRADHRPRAPIEHRSQDDGGEQGSPEAGRYA